MAQTLFSQSISQPSSQQPVTRKLSLTQPCNTPTMSSSFTWAHVADLHRQFAVSQNVDTPVLDGSDEVDKDERMVEDLLVPSSPLSTNQLTSQLLLPPAPVAISQYTSHPYYSTLDSPSSFTSTDPFYIAQSEAGRNCSTLSRSTISQLEPPSQQSPFVISEPFPHRRETHSSPLPLSGYSYTLSGNLSRFQPLTKVADGG